MTDWNLEIEKLAMRARTGGEKNRQELIEYCLGLVRYKADQMVKTSPRLLNCLKEDIRSEGVLALIKAVDTLLKGTHKEDGNSLGYISVAISRGMGIFVDDELKKSNAVPFEDTASGVSSASLLELWDTLNSICQSEEERNIIEMRSFGYTDSQIAEVLDLPQTTVSQLRRELYDRFTRH